MPEAHKTVVVIDDSRTFVMYAGMLLKRLGFEVIPAVTAEDGLQLARVFQPHAILLDRYMPDMDGTGVLKILKDEPELAEIPVVMVSASDKAEVREECFQLGCADYLSKPLTPFSLQQALLVNLPLHGAQRRRFLRASYQRKVSIRSATLNAQLYAVSLSEGGVYLRYPKPLPVGTRVEVELPLDDGRTLEVAGQVIYQKEICQGALQIEPGMAVAFDGDDHAAKTLRRFVSGLLAADLVDEQEEPILQLD